MRILGIETSCDDTCIAVVDARGGKTRPQFTVHANIVSSQIKTHAEFGGVMPTLAAREHARNIAPVLKRALQVSGFRSQDIDLIAVTTHPGLLPSLLVGTHAARALAWATKKPIIGVNHLQGHVIANLLPPIRKISKFEARNSKQIQNSKFKIPKITFPAIALIVSGGHTQLVLVKDLQTFRVVGETRDDAAGEAFDKVGRLLGLPFPGGPHIAREAKRGNPDAIDFPRPMLNSRDLDFSFSGLKTSVLYFLRDAKKTRARSSLPDICASFQQAIIDVLIAKTTTAAKRYHAKTIVLGGGVAANQELRLQLRQIVASQLKETTLVIPRLPYTLDNAAMIAAAGYLQWQSMPASKRKRATWKNTRVQAGI